MTWSLASHGALGYQTGRAELLPGHDRNGAAPALVVAHLDEVGDEERLLGQAAMLRAGDRPAFDAVGLGRRGVGVRPLPAHRRAATGEQGEDGDEDNGLASEKTSRRDRSATPVRPGHPVTTDALPMR